MYIYSRSTKTFFRKKITLFWTWKPKKILQEKCFDSFEMLKIRFFVLNLPGLMSQYSSILKKSKHYLSKVSLALVKVAIVVQYVHLPILFHINLPYFFQSAFKYAYNNVSDMYCYFRYVIYFNKLVCMTRPSSDGFFMKVHI